MHALKPHQFEEFLSGYMAAALWSSTDTSHEDAMDSLEGFAWAEAEDDKRRHECLEFIKAAGLNLHRYYRRIGPLTDATPYERAGHDFWLDRSGHGVGFWDRGLGKLGVKLSALCGLCNQFPPVDLYLGDDGLVHS